MNASWPLVATLAAAVVAVPGAAIAYGVPAQGPARIPDRWWTGTPAPVAARIAIAATSGLAAGLVAVTTSGTPAGAALTAMVVVCVILAAVDLRRRRLPHPITGMAWMAAIASVMAEAVDSGSAGLGVQALASALGTVSVLLGVALAFPGKLGLGDVSLAGAIALSLGWAGWFAAIGAVWIGLLLQLVVALGALAAGVPRDRALPLGPALVAGWLIGIVATSSV